MSSDTPHRPQKKWGQNFLRNESAVRQIVDAVQAQSGELILEIGPGEGALTQHLAALGNPLSVIEIDPDLAARIHEKFAGEHFRLIHGDATVVELPSEPFVAVGNLPYNVGNPIIRRVIQAPGFRRGVFMVQKEVASRLTAKPGDDAYGFLTLAVQMFARTRVLLTLGPGSFHPPPKVKSSVVVFERDEPPLKTPREELLRLISGAFRMRRKKLTNSLEAAGMNKERVAAALIAIGIDENVRAETLSLEDFDRLAQAIGQGEIASRLPSPPEELR